VAIKLGELAVRYGCELRGDPDVEVDSVGTLDGAGPGAISFLANPGYRSFLATTSAAAVILADEEAADCPVACLVTKQPYVVYAQVAAELYPPAPLSPGVHPGVVCGSGARIPDSAEISAGVVLGDNVSLGERSRIGPNCVIGDHAVMGADTRLLANVTLCSDVQLGDRCLIHPGAVIGADGFGNARSDTGWIKVPQVGSVVLGNDVEIGANTTIDRGAIGDTVLGNGVRIDNLCQIGHNVTIGDHTAMAAMSGISGSSRVGARCMIAGQSGISGHVSIVDDVILLGSSGVAKSISKPGVYASMFSIEEAGTWRRLLARFNRLDIYAKKIKEIEATLKKLSK
jgi:UDP-3-O-[3-hydroxymyristoyl] glucosamine N-acyltransferase